MNVDGVMSRWCAGLCRKKAVDSATFAHDSDALQVLLAPVATLSLRMS